MARAGPRVGTLADGSYILARAGLLGGYRCTIHWSCLPGFTETFPDIVVSTELYQIDRNRFTASGGTAAMDMMLHMIEVDHGRDLAMAVACGFVSPPHFAKCYREQYNQVPKSTRVVTARRAPGNGAVAAE